MKNVFTSEFIQEIKELNDIIEVASEYFNLKLSGNVYKARCKHTGGDKTPSLTFFPETQSFYCFGCHAGKKNGKTEGSDVISFIQWVENITWQEAILLLANKVELEIPTASLSNEDKQKAVLYSKVLAENRVYWTNLYKKNAKDVKAWFYNRGIEDEDVTKWRLGVSSQKWNKQNILVPTYSIMDEYGRTVSFSMRMGKSDMKYKNGSTSPIFKKGNIIYGLNFIKRELRKHKAIVIVEGYNDAIILQKYGVPAGAIMSTSITEGQVQLIKKYVDNAILFLDGDEAGIINTISNIQFLKKHEVEVDVINILGFDPDEVALKYKEDTFDFILKNKMLDFQYLINNVLNKYFDSALRLKRETIKQLEEILDYIEDETERKVYKNQLLEIMFMGDKNNLN